MSYSNVLCKSLVQTCQHSFSSSFLLPKLIKSNNIFNNTQYKLNTFSLLQRNQNRIQISNFSTTPSLLKEKSKKRKSKRRDDIKIIFQYHNGDKKSVNAREGVSLLEVARDNKIELEGACEGSCACSTCHVIIDPKFYDKLNEPTEEEDDLLDLAYGLTDTSRLGCQVVVDEKLDGMTVKIPKATRNLAVDGYKPKPH